MEKKILILFLKKLILKKEFNEIIKELVSKNN